MALAIHDGWGEEERRTAKMIAHVVNAVLRLGKDDAIKTTDLLPDWTAEPEKKQAVKIVTQFYENSRYGQIHTNREKEREVWKLLQQI